METGELHLLIIWERARYKQNKIIEDISKHLKIVEAFEVEWSKEAVSSNFTRFYGVKLPDHSFKEKECGTGKFVLLLLWDETPDYATRATSRGDEVVNTLMFDLKSKYRSWTGGGHKIHATNSPSETNHDIMLLLGVTYQEFLSSHKGNQWEGNIVPIKRNITGHDGWNSLAEFFKVINNTTEYVVLRGKEHLDNKENSEHLDVDLLVRDYKSFIFICKPQKQLFGYERFFFRPKIEVKIGDRIFLFDIWSTHLQYFSDSWMTAMFKEKELNGLYFKQSLKNDFYSLIYHCLYRKRKTSQDYIPVLYDMCNELGLNEGYNQDSFAYPMDYFFELLSSFMWENKYEFTNVPYTEDRHCFNRNQLPEINRLWHCLREKVFLGMSNIKPYKVDEATSISGYCYFTAIYDNRKVFVKCGGVGDSWLNEKDVSLIAKKIGKDHILAPIQSYSDENCNLLIYDFIKGSSIEEAISKRLINKEDAFKQLEDIRVGLKKAGVYHRDIRPENFAFVNGKLILFDFQFAIIGKKELDCLKGNYSILMNLGGGYRYKRYSWNDAYSFNKMYQELNLINADSLNFSKRETVSMSFNDICGYLLSRFCEKTKNHIRARFEPRA